jgi:hypothetical protein
VKVHLLGGSEILDLIIKTIHFSDFDYSDQTITATLVERLLPGETPFDETVKNGENLKNLERLTIQKGLSTALTKKQ